MAIKTWRKKKLMGHQFDQNGNTVAVFPKKDGGITTLIVDPNVLANAQVGQEYDLDVDQDQTPWRLMALKPPTDPPAKGGWGGGARVQPDTHVALNAAAAAVGNALRAGMDPQKAPAMLAAMASAGHIWLQKASSAPSGFDQGAPVPTQGNPAPQPQQGVLEAELNDDIPF